MSKTYDELRRAEQTRRASEMNNAALETASVSMGLHINGQVSGNGDLLVNGSVEGPIQLEDGTLTVGASGTTNGDVVAREVIVHGNIKGNLRARDRIEIKTNGSVVGDLTTARIIIEDGAYFKGSIEVGHEVIEPKPPQAFAATASPANSQGS